MPPLAPWFSRDANYGPLDRAQGATDGTSRTVGSAQGAKDGTSRATESVTGSVPGVTAAGPAGSSYVYRLSATGALEATVAPYFDAIATIWKERSYSIASYVLQFFYPGPLASQGLIDATNAWLEANPDIPALRRLVIENLAGVERAVAAQKRDAQG